MDELILLKARFGELVLQEEVLQNQKADVKAKIVSLLNRSRQANKTDFKRKNVKVPKEKETNEEVK